MPARDFSAVYDEHVWQVYGFFSYRMGSRADAEDLTQKTFERALRSWSRYDPSRDHRSALLSGPEIAEATGLSVANVQQILSRSLRRMRIAIEQAKPAPRPDSATER